MRTTDTEAEPTGTYFFPNPNTLLGRGDGVLTGYLQAIYWAWAHLSGTGNVESVPTTALQVSTALLVHVCGMTLYAIVTGNVVAILESVSE
eukprot:scaffold8911_cov166-Amphora_coffeaeformis.AAC.2